MARVKARQRQGSLEEVGVTRSLTPPVRTIVHPTVLDGPNHDIRDFMVPQGDQVRVKPYLSMS